MRPGKAELISFLWGFAEATFFFLVPDIWLSRIAITNPKRAFTNLCFALTGALIGGAMMYMAGSAMPDKMVHLLDKVPAISLMMIMSVKAQVSDHAIFSMFRGAITGIPYKIYAVMYGQFATPFGIFLIASALARSLRFAIVIALTCLLSRIAKKFTAEKNLNLIHAILWTGFYIFYWSYV